MKNEKSSKSISASIFSSKKNIVIAGVIAAVIIVLVAISMIIESGYGKLVIKNKTDMKLEYVKTGFINIEGVLSDTLQTGSIAGHETLSSDLEHQDLLETQSNLEVSFQFENKEALFTDAGYFNSDFDGNIVITFLPTEDPNLVTLKIKAKNGLFKSNTIDCDEEFTVDLAEGKILE